MKFKLVFDGLDPEVPTDPGSSFNNYDLQDNRTEIEAKESTELGESLQHLNDDTTDPLSRMSGIDMRSNLHPIEISGILAWDFLTQVRVLPITALSLTRGKKRISVSKLGQGRKDIVDIVGGKREQDAKTSGGLSMGERIRGIFSPGKKDDGS
jgi:hypothetical protein